MSVTLPSGDYRIRPLMNPDSSQNTVPPDTPKLALGPYELLVIKQTAYRQALQQAWFATSLEQTKAIFTLASAGVGLALTLIYSDHIKELGSWAPLWLLFATVAFAISAGLCIWIFRINGRLVKALAHDEDAAVENGLVGRVDTMTRLLFGIGMLFLVLSAVAQVWL